MEYLVVGLGNPGKEYRPTRHNAGFLVVEYLMKELQAEAAVLDCGALVSRVRRGGHRILLAKPQTFMNLSGKAVRMIILKYEIPLSRIIIILDDLALPFGMIRLRRGGGAAGLKGLHWGLVVPAGVFPGWVWGLGSRGRRWEAASFVLDSFSPEEKELLPEITAWAGRAVLTWIERGIEVAMSRYNGLVPSLRG